jgi:hypothetical protein
MARLSSIKRILTESFPEVKWIGTLLAPINQFIEEVNRALNNELTFADNFDGMVKTITADGTYPVKFQWTRKSRPVVAWIGYIREIDGEHTNLGAAVSLDWEYTGDGTFKINALPGLSASAADKFYVTIVAMAG